MDMFSIVHAWVSIACNIIIDITIRDLQLRFEFGNTYSGCVREQIMIMISKGNLHAECPNAFIELASMKRREEERGPIYS